MFLVVSDLQTGLGAAEGSLSNSDPAQAVVRRAEELLDEGDVCTARKMIVEALDAGESHADLLWALADVEFADGNLGAGSNGLTAAVDATGRDAAATGRQIRVLYLNDMWREALLAAERISASLRDDPLVRAEVGRFYQGCGCYAHAADGYKQGDGLPRRVRAARRWCWWRSGGPSARLRRKVCVWEESELLRGLRQPVRFTDQLDKVPGLSDRDVLRLRSQIETVEYRWRRRSAAFQGLGRTLYRLLPAGAFLVWLVLAVIVGQVHFLSGPGGTAAGSALSAVVATALVVAIVKTFIRPDLQFRFQLRISSRTIIALLFSAVVFEVAVAEGYAHHVLPAGSWWAWVILGLAAVPAVLACGLATPVVMDLLSAMKGRQQIREDCLLEVLDLLLEILNNMRTAPGYHQLHRSLYQAQYLETAARWLTRHLLPPPFVGYVGSGDWLTGRVAGWAEALRYMQRQMVAPVPGGWAKLEATLVNEIRCLATGDLGALAWRQPPPRPSRRTILRQRTITVARTILVAALPLAAVLATQPLLHESPGAFGWARAAAAAWALLYVVLSLDPAIRDKIDTTSQIVGLLRNPRSTD